MTDSTLDPTGGQLGRRAEYAEQTRRAILASARQLFREKGYFATKVDDIARSARVSPATVHAVTAGKAGLLRTLMDSWTTAPIVPENVERIENLDDPATILDTVAAVTRQMREDYGDVMRVMIATAPHEPAAAESLATATARYRSPLIRVAERLAELGALRDGVDTQEAADILWFFFGYSGFFTLIDDNGWSYTRAEQWLRAAADRALLTK